MNVCVHSEFICWNCDTQCEGVSRWSLWEVIRVGLSHVGGAPVQGFVPLWKKKKRDGRLLALFERLMRTETGRGFSQNPAMLGHWFGTAILPDYEKEVSTVQKITSMGKFVIEAQAQTNSMLVLVTIIIVKRTSWLSDESGVSTKVIVYLFLWATMSVKMTISLKDIWGVFLGSLKMGIHQNVVISKQT